jgi:hypothetical protein
MRERSSLIKHEFNACLSMCVRKREEERREREVYCFAFTLRVCGFKYQ